MRSSTETRNKAVTSQTKVCGENIRWICGEEITCVLPKGHEGKHSFVNAEVVGKP